MPHRIRYNAAARHQAGFQQGSKDSKTEATALAWAAGAATWADVENVVITKEHYDSAGEYLYREAWVTITASPPLN